MSKFQNVKKIGGTDYVVNVVREFAISKKQIHSRSNQNLKNFYFFQPEFLLKDFVLVWDIKGSPPFWDFSISIYFLPGRAILDLNSLFLSLQNYP